MDNFGEAAEQRERTSDQVNEACKFFREHVIVMKLLYRLNSKPAFMHLKWTSKVLSAVIIKTKELTGVDAINYYLTDDMFVDVINLMRYLDTHIQFIIKQMDSQFDESTNYFSCEIKRIIHIQAARMNMSEFIPIFNQFFPENYYVTSNLSTDYKTHLNIHTETIRNLIASALQRLDHFYGLHKAYLSRGLCSVMVDFVEGEEWRCSGGCNKVFDCSSDFQIFDCCNHLYCGECYLQFYDMEVHKCPKCSSKVVVSALFSSLKKDYGGDDPRLYSEICRCGGKKRAEASRFACSTDVASVGQSDSGDLVITVTETHPEQNLNVNYAGQSMYLDEQVMDVAIDSSRVHSIAHQPHPALDDQAVTEQPVDQHVEVDLALGSGGIEYQIQQDPAIGNEIAEDQATIPVIMDVPVAPGNEGEGLSVVVKLINEDELPVVLVAEDGSITLRLHEGYDGEGNVMHYYVLQQNNQN